MNLAELEAEAFLLGQWRNFDELEMNLSLPELEAILDAERKRQYAHNKFMAALKGINLDSDAANEEDPFERAVAKAHALAEGKSTDEHEFDSIGFGFEEEDEYEEED